MEGMACNAALAHARTHTQLLGGEHYIEKYSSSWVFYYKNSKACFYGFAACFGLIHKPANKQKRTSVCVIIVCDPLNLKNEAA